MKRLALLLLLVACAKEQPPAATATEPAKPAPPSVAEARVLIANAPELGDHQFTFAAFSMPMTKAAMSPEALAAAEQLKNDGWLAFDGAGNVVLSRKAENDKRFVTRPNGFVDLVPLAKKELIAVTSTAPDPEGASVQFRWKWIPNELGTAFDDRYAAEQQSTATLIWDGSRWVVLRIR